MSYIDLHEVLRDWPYEPDKISVRKILGADESVRIQMRVELGVLQMAAEGRPDGTRPHGCDSLLAYHHKRLAKHQERNGTPLGFVLSPAECEALRQEASQFYRRYIAYFVLEEFDGVVDDTTHSLGLLDLCRDYAMEPDDRSAMEEFRAYVVMMQTRGLAYHAMEEEEPASALAHVNRGIMDIRSLFAGTESEARVEEAEEMRILRSLAAELGGKLPRNSLVRTRKALRSAVDQERFEDAARLRDQLKRLFPRSDQERV
ncbi:MAG: UvrB/UvrC motif-containing protein [Planctomycetota bacterium]